MSIHNTQHGRAISMSLIILVLVACAVGAMTALVLDGLLPAGNRLLAIAAGIVAVVLASLARYRLVFFGTGTGSDESQIPTVLVMNAAIASIAGSLAAHDLWGYTALESAVFLGALAGLFSAILMALLMITYHANTTPRA